jgi:replicative DNA helicase
MPRDINELPNNEEAERSLIGLTLVKGYIPAGARSLATTDFYNRQNRETWSAFLELTEENRTIEPLSTIEILKRISNRTVTPSELLATSHGLPPGTIESPFVEKIRSAAARRLMIAKLNDGIQALIRGDKGVIGNLRRELDQLEYTEESKGSFVSMANVVNQEIRPALADLRQGITHRISTGWEQVDRHIGGGLSLSDILLVVGLPGGGKSAFVLQLASNMAAKGYPVAFLSGEMSNRENGLRMLSQLSKSYNLNSTTHLSESDEKVLMPWVDYMEKLPIEWDCRTYDLQTLGTSLRSLVAEKGIRVLVIDYIQLLKLNRYDKNGRTERITEASQEVKRIAMEFGIAVIEVAQFNREGALSEKPKMQHLEGSSQLEKDTSLIFIIDRTPDTQNVSIRIVKGRNTGEATIDGVFTGWNLRFGF